jgi:MYXO-CTERM domain-containing protein
MQPDGQEIPIVDEEVTVCEDKNVQVCLNEAEGDEEAIDAMTDGNVVPETFDPTCNLTFEVLARGAENKNIFGWYNVVPDPANPGQNLKPDDEDLYTFILASEDPADPGDPELSRELSLTGDANYAGGDIGFFICTGSEPEAELGGPPSDCDEIFYSERAFNPDSEQEDPYTHLIIWQSVNFRNAFYFGWEDVIQGDDDFDDIFTRVTGITCSGGGEAWETGEEGVCAEGTMQCQQGELACVPNIAPSDEKCDALDNDCDGETDEGDDLCDDGLVCDRGKCVPPCGSGEFPCTAGFVCSAAGTCVDPLCEGVDCDPGQVCNAGECIDACKDVTCPYGHVCRLGVCVDPCESIECDEGYSCNLGVCVDCDCKGCDDGFTCSDNVCVDDACSSVTCDAGSHCVDGDCVDNCEGAECPGGAACVDGACMPPGSVNGAGGDGDGEGGDDGGGVVITGGSSSGGSSSGGSSNGGTNGSVGDEEGSVEAKGCGCRTVGGGSLGASTALLAAAGALGLALRRRRRAA